MTSWEDVIARTSGLAGRLLDQDALRSLARSVDLHELARALEEEGFLVGPVSDAVRPAELDRAVRRRAAAGLELLAGRCGERARLLQVVFEDEDRRSLRSLVRGAAQGASWEERLGGLVPTPTLPERVLEELARVETTAQLATLLSIWRNPYGPALREARRPQPDLFRLETALHAAFFRRARRACSDPDVCRYVAELVDLENARALLLLAAQGHDTDPLEAFLPGGRALSRGDFLEVAKVEDPSEIAVILAEHLVLTPWGRVFERHAGDLGHLEEAALGALVFQVRRRARATPLGPMPILLYALRVRAETLDLRRIVWGVALDHPRSALELSLVEV